MTFDEKLRMALAKQNMSQAALARALDTTPNAFNQRVKVGKWKEEDYEKINTNKYLFDDFNFKYAYS